MAEKNLLIKFKFNYVNFDQLDKRNFIKNIREKIIKIEEYAINTADLIVIPMKITIN